MRLVLFIFHGSVHALGRVFYWVTSAARKEA